MHQEINVVAALTPLFPAPVVFENDGADLLSTDFWESERGQGGLFYASYNASTLRLLLPATAAAPRLRAEMAALAATASEVVVSLPRRSSVIPGTDRGFELGLVWVDGRMMPFSVHLTAGQIDGRITLATLGRRPRVSVWEQGTDGKPVKLSNLPGRARYVGSLPYVRPWGR